MRHAALIEDKGVKFVSRFEAADFAEETAAGFCSHPEDFFQGQRLQVLIQQSPYELGYLSGLHHGSEDGKGGTSGYV